MGNKNRPTREINIIIYGKQWFDQYNQQTCILSSYFWRQFQSITSKLPFLLFWDAQTMLFSAIAFLTALSMALQLSTLRWTTRVMFICSMDHWLFLSFQPFTSLLGNNKGDSNRHWNFLPKFHPRKRKCQAQRFFRAYHQTKMKKSGLIISISTAPILKCNNYLWTKEIDTFT